MIGQAITTWWAIACIVIAAVLILGACVTVPPLRRRARAVSVEPVGPQPDDFPTTPLPAVPDLPSVPAPSAPPSPPRWIVSQEGLLWCKTAVDAEGPITLGLLPQDGGQLGVLVDVDGEASGVRLDRHEIQGLRDALTNHLVDTARPVRS